jgi:hypothetical protein
MDSLIVYQSPYTKRRIGKPNDGGYVIADLPESYDILISGGVSDDISFEDHFMSTHPDLSCYAFDGTVDSLPNASSKVTFVRKNLGNTNSDTMTDLIEYMEPYSDIFLKIDIEGHEFRVIPNLPMQKVKQLVLEIHTPADIHLYPTYYPTLQDIENPSLFALLSYLNITHTLVHFHANNGCGIHTIDGIQVPNVFEVTYIRNDFVHEKVRNIQPFPTPLDMKNVPSLPEHKYHGYPFSVPHSSRPTLSWLHR